MPATGEFNVGVLKPDDIHSGSSGSDSGGHSEDEELALRRYNHSLSRGPPVGSVFPANHQSPTSDRSVHQAATQRPGSVKQLRSVSEEGHAKPALNMEERCLSQLSREKHEGFLKTCINELLEEALFKGISKENKVLNWTNPEDLSQIFDMTLHKDPQSDEQLLEAIRNTIKYSVKTGHPYFVNQLFSTVDPYGLIGQWTTDALNPSVYTYEVSPVFTLMEEAVLREMRKIVGFSVDGEGDGIFVPGGSMANGYAISCARYKSMPDVKSVGLHGLKRMVIFTSEDAHYSVQKLASFMGIGSANVYAIRTDPDTGKMSIEHLQKEIERVKSEDAVPLMVSATAGTTVLGAFDPLPEIADLCAQHNMWMHVDAAWGGGALVSQKYRKLLNGIERADSVTWNPHKLLAAPQQCSTFLTRHSDILRQCHSCNATYLFQKDKFYDTRFDTGDKHIQCGRRADVFKFWFMWRAKGTNGFEKHIDRVFEAAEYLTDMVRERSDFEMVIDQPECTNICFWYIPPSLRDEPRGEDFNAKLHKVAPKIKERMMKEGSLMMTYQPLRTRPNFFRFVLQNSSLDKADMEYVLNKITELGADL